MTEKHEVYRFLEDFKSKLGLWGVVYRDDRQKNTQTLLTLDIIPKTRTETLAGLEIPDYSAGPIEETLYGGAAMWVFGRMIKGKEVYIKITMGNKDNKVICISFHLAEKPMTYPFK